MPLAPDPQAYLLPLYWGPGWFGLLLGFPFLGYAAVTAQGWVAGVGILVSVAGSLLGVRVSRDVYATDREIVWRGGIFGIAERHMNLLDVTDVVLERSVWPWTIPNAQDIAILGRDRRIHLHYVPNAAAVRAELNRRRQRLREASGAA